VILLPTLPKRGRGQWKERKKEDASEFAQPVPLSSGEGRGEVKTAFLPKKKARHCEYFLGKKERKKRSIATQKICGNLLGLKLSSTCSNQGPAKK